MSTDRSRSKSQKTFRLKEQANNHHQNAHHVHQAHQARHKDKASWAQRFFPWTTETEQKHADFMKKRTFPWLGLSALVIAAFTCFFTWLILFLINDKKEVQSKALKPASWLSALLSVNSIALHVALSEGVTTACLIQPLFRLLLDFSPLAGVVQPWGEPLNSPRDSWYTATRKDATYNQLHETWRFGTSLSAVLSSGKRFNYVALATVFVATIPLNGFLLQNAISLVPFTYVNETTILTSVPQTWPVGFSATYGSQSGIGTYSAALGNANYLSGTLNQQYSFISVDGDSAGGYDTFYQSGCFNKDNTAVCSGNVTSVGFKPTCYTEKIPYNMKPSANPGNFSARVFDSNVTWSPSSPNSFNISVLWKPEIQCEGVYYRKTCIMEAANVTYPVQIYSSANVAGAATVSSDDAQPVIGLNYDVFTLSDTYNNLLPVDPDDCVNGTTYGGFAQALGFKYNGSLDWHYHDGAWSIEPTGAFAGAMAPAVGFLTIFTDHYGFNPTLTDADFCNLTYVGQNMQDSEPDVNGKTNDVVDTMRGFVRQFAFMSSLQLFDANTITNQDLENSDPLYYAHHAQRVTAQQSQLLLKYDIRFIYWWASLVITLVIALFIAPTFYGFWKLRKAATLSPFDTAGAFKAPVIANHKDWESKQTKVLLREVGTMPVHEIRKASIQPVTVDPEAQRHAVTVTEMEMAQDRPEVLMRSESQEIYEPDHGAAEEVIVPQRPMLYSQVTDLAIPKHESPR